jgi:hypothetical protein
VADNLLNKRFAELREQADEVMGSEKIYNRVRETNDIDSNTVLNWEIKAKSLIGQACGPDSEHAKAFESASEGGMYSTNLKNMKRMISVFDAAQEDFVGGYLKSTRSLVQAEVFGSELEQAAELLKSGYSVPAAVVAGTVLETCLRELCDRNGIQHGKLDKMNGDLTKAGAYNAIAQKRITYLAAVRNSAAHGKKNEFEQYDVAAMIDEIERFVSQYLT